MNLKRFVQCVLLVSFVVSLVVVSITPTLASPKHDNVPKFYGASAEVRLSLPSNTTQPAPAGIANHPETLIIGSFDFDKRSSSGPVDELIVHKWDSYLNQFMPVLIITDNAAHAEFLKTVWNNTYIWYPTPIPLIPVVGPNLFPNVVLVQPSELEVWTESARTIHGNYHTADKSNTFWVNLTKPISVTLPATVNPATGSLVFVDQSFTLAPLTLMIKSTSDPWDGDFKSEGLIRPGLSGYTIEWKGDAEFSNAKATIPSWIGKAYWLTTTGFVYWHMTVTYTPTLT